LPAQSKPPRAEVFSQLSESVERWRPLVKKYFVTDKLTNEALQIIKCESQGNPDAVGDKHLTYWKNKTQYGYSVGLFQVRLFPKRPTKEYLLDPENNIKYAHTVYKASGWKPWSCRRVLK